MHRSTSLTGGGADPGGPGGAYRTLLVALVALVACAAPAAPPQLSPDDRGSAGAGVHNSTDPETSLADSILALTHDLADAWTRLDPDDYLGRFSPDLIFYFEGRTVPRAEFEAVVRQSMGSLQSSTFEVLDPEVEVLGPDAAVVSFGLREEMVDRAGGVTDLRAALTLVFERRGGEWVIVRAHESLLRSPAAAGPQEPGYHVESFAPDVDGVLRVLIHHDMEELSGQTDWRTYLFRYAEQYRRGQELLAADVNAVIEGLFAGGADEVHVVDGHSSGNPEPDLRPELLDPRAQQVLRDEPFDAYTDLVGAGLYDAVATVGMHAKSGSRGFASHTGLAGTQLLLEGRSITETELLALSWGRVGVPVIFASGDDVLREDLSTMSWLKYVTVKEAVSADSALLRPVDEARADLREGAKRAVESLSRMRVMRPGAPLSAAVRAIPPADLSALEGLPGITYDNGTVSFVAPDFQAAYDGWLALMRVAEAGYVGVLFEALADHPAGEEILDDAWARHFALWFDVESGRWSPPPPGPEERRKYHGYRE